MDRPRRGQFVNVLVQTSPGNETDETALVTKVAKHDNEDGSVDVGLVVFPHGQAGQLTLGNVPLYATEDDAVDARADRQSVAWVEDSAEPAPAAKKAAPKKATTPAE